MPSHHFRLHVIIRRRVFICLVVSPQKGCRFCPHLQVRAAVCAFPRDVCYLTVWVFSSCVDWRQMCLKHDVLVFYHYLSFVSLDFSLWTMSHIQEFISCSLKVNNEINPCQSTAHLRNMIPSSFAFFSSELVFEIDVYCVLVFLDSFTTYEGLLNNFSLWKYGFCAKSPYVIKAQSSFPVYKDCFYFEIA